MCSARGVTGDFKRGLLLAMSLLNCTLQQRHNVVGQHRDRETEQRRPWMPQALDFAAWHRPQALEQALDAPTLASECRDRCCINRRWQVTPQPNCGLARFGRSVQRDLEAPPWGWPGPHEGPALRWLARAAALELSHCPPGGCPR